MKEEVEGLGDPDAVDVLEEAEGYEGEGRAAGCMRDEGSGEENTPGGRTCL